jgi:hypothetical protein
MLPTALQVFRFAQANLPHFFFISSKFRHRQKAERPAVKAKCLFYKMQLIIWAIPILSAWLPSLM